MQKKNFLLLALSWLFTAWTVHAIPPYNLPAPTNIQFSQPNSFTVNITWNAVPGAAAYAATLQNVYNGTAIKTSNPTTNNATFTVVPGDYYLFRVAAQSLEPDGSYRTSLNRGEQGYAAEIIIIDLIVKKVAPCLNPNEIATIYPGDTYSSLVSGNVYNIEIRSSSLRLGFEFYYHNPSAQIDCYRLNNNPSGEDVKGLEYLSPGSLNPPPQYLVPPVLCSNVRAIYGFLAGNFSFPTPTSIHYEGVSGSSLRILACGENHQGGGGERSFSASDLDVQQKLLNILPVNPFSSNLTLYFQEHPEQPVTAQLFDVSGRMHLQQTIEPASVGENRYILNTADLTPGMYFLRLETAPGVFSTHKVVKYDE